MTSRVLEKPTGALILCDVVYNDRGKFSILGGGWTVVPHTRSTLHFLAAIQLPPDWDDRDLELEFRLHTSTTLAQDGKPERLVRLTGRHEAVEADGANPPSWAFDLPFEMNVQLKPDTQYFLELWVAGQAVAWKPFLTHAADEDGNPQVGETDE